MNELQVKTISKEPAKIDFNFEELSSVLDEQLKKYEGLEFTEEQAKECKKVITELNKGKKSLNDYRLETKKELSKEINDFEAQCKNLSNKFDDVIKPLKSQADEFEEDRKNEKRLEIEGRIDHLVHIEGLSDKYADQLIIEDKYLNKSTTMKSIEDELTIKAQHLGIQQDKEDGDKEIIKMSVEAANDRYNVELLESTYIRLLDHEGIEQIKPMISEDAQKEAEKQKQPEYTGTNCSRCGEPQFETPSGVTCENGHGGAEPKQFKKVPLSSAPKSVSKDDYIEKYEVTGTESQLDALEEYMSSQGLTWKVIEK